MFEYYPQSIQGYCVRLPSSNDIIEQITLSSTPQETWYPIKAISCAEKAVIGNSPKSHFYFCYVVVLQNMEPQDHPGLQEKGTLDVIFFIKPLFSS